VCRSSQSSLQHYVPSYWSEKVCIHGMIKYILSEYGVTFIYELFFQVFKNFVVYVVECLPHSERCSDRTSQHCHTLQCSQKMCIRGCVKIVQSTTIWHSRKSWFSRFERAALSPLPMAML